MNMFDIQIIQVARQVSTMPDTFIKVAAFEMQRRPLMFVLYAIELAVQNPLNHFSGFVKIFGLVRIPSEE